MSNYTLPPRIGGFHSDIEVQTYIKLPKDKLKSNKLKGPYLMGDTIGEGAFAKVKVATHIQTNEKVAIKILDKTKFFKDDEDINRVQKEIAILKRLKHKNIIQLYEIMESKKNLYIVMEYCEGKELFDYIVKKRKLTEIEACKFFQEIINALEYLHQNNITHRDLKPENLLLDQKHSIKISDFGLSTINNSKGLLSTPCGTPNYAPPEMLRGDEYNGLLSDVWSCGIILYAMLCGYLPFSESKEQIIYQKIIDHDYEYPAFLSENSKNLMKNILQIDPKKRYDIEKIKSHPWFLLIKPNLKPGISMGKLNIPIDEKILRMVESLGYDMEICRNKLISNKYDSITTIYYLSLRKYIREGGKSISDLHSKEYLEYICNEYERLGFKCKDFNLDEKKESKYNEISISRQYEIIEANITNNDEEDRYNEVYFENFENINEGFDPANADVDLIDENVRKNGSIIDNDLYTKLPKNSLTDRTLNTKIKLIPQSEKVISQSEKKPLGEISEPYIQEKENHHRNIKNVENLTKEYENYMNKDIYIENLSNNKKTRNNFKEKCRNEITSFDSQRMTITNIKKENSQEKIQKHASFLIENSDSENNEKTKMKDETARSTNGLYENIIEIVANLNNKNGLNNPLNDEFPTERSIKTENDLQNNQTFHRQYANSELQNSQSQQVTSINPNNKNTNIIVNSISESENIHIDKNLLIEQIGEMAKQKILVDNDGKLNSHSNAKYSYYGNDSNNLEDLYNIITQNIKNSLSTKNINANNDRNYSSSNANNLDYKADKSNQDNTNSHVIHSSEKNINKQKNMILIRKNKLENKDQNNLFNNKFSYGNVNNKNNSKDKKQKNKLIYLTKNEKKKEKKQESTSPVNTQNKINVNNIFDKQLIIKNIRKMNTGESDNFEKNHNIDDKQKSNNNSKNKKIKNMINKITNNLNEKINGNFNNKNSTNSIGNIYQESKISRPKNLILQNYHMKSFVSSKTNGNVNSINQEKSINKKENIIGVNTTKNPSFLSQNILEIDFNKNDNEVNNLENIKKERINNINNWNSVCIPTEIYIPNNISLKDKEMDYNQNFREKLKEYSASIASPLEIKENSLKKITLTNSTNTSVVKNILNRRTKETYEETSSLITSKLFSKERHKLGKEKAKEKEIIGTNLNLHKKPKKVISLNTNMINYHSNNPKLNTQNTFSPNNSNKKKSNEILSTGENVNYGSFHQNTLNNIINSSSIVWNTNNINVNYSSNFPQSNKNKLKISINKNYVKSPMNPDLRSKNEVYNPTNQAKKVNMKDIVNNMNSSQTNKINAEKTFEDNEIKNNLIIKSFTNEDKPINSKKDLDADKIIFEAEELKLRGDIEDNNLNVPNVNFNTSLQRKNHYVLNDKDIIELVKNKSNTEEIKEVQFAFDGIYNDTKGIICNEFNISENETDELNRLELSSNINVIQFIANKLVEKSISNLETTLKTNLEKGENSRSTYSNFYKSILKHDALNSDSNNNSNIKKTLNSLRNSLSQENNSNNFSIKDFNKDIKKDSNDSINTSFIDMKDCDFDDMINMLNKKYRNLVCCQNLEIKERENSDVNLSNMKKINVEIKENISLDRDANENLKFDSNILIRNELNKNLANSFVLPIAGKTNVENTNMNSVPSNKLGNVMNNNININNSAALKNPSKYSKSFIVKQKNTNQNNNFISTSNNNLITNIKNQNGNGNNSKQKNKYLKKIPNKSSLNVGKNNLLNKKSYKSQKKTLKIKETKETGHIISSNQKQPNNINLLNRKINDFVTDKQLKEDILFNQPNFNGIMNIYSNIVNSNSQYNYKNNIISNNTSMNNPNKKEEKSFFSENFNPSNIDSDNNTATLPNKNHNSNYESNISNENTISCIIINNKNGKLERKHTNRINITNNLFNKNAILDISATYDPDLDSRNETSVERSKSIHKRNKFYDIAKISMSPKKDNFNKNNLNTANMGSINNVKIMNNMRDSSVSSANSNQNENLAAGNKIEFNNFRLVENSNDIVANYDTMNSVSSDKNRGGSFGIRKNSVGQSSLKAKRFGSIGIISEDDEFNNMNLSIAKSKEPFNLETIKSSSKNVMNIEDQMSPYCEQNIDFSIYPESKFIAEKLIEMSVRPNIIDDEMSGENSNIFRKSFKIRSSKTKNSSHSPVYNENLGNKNIHKKLKNIFPLEKRVTIDLANSMDKKQN